MIGILDNHSAFNNVMTMGGFNISETHSRSLQTIDVAIDDFWQVILDNEFKSVDIRFKTRLEISKLKIKLSNKVIGLSKTIYKLNPEQKSIFMNDMVYCSTFADVKNLITTVKNM